LLGGEGKRRRKEMWSVALVMGGCRSEAASDQVDEDIEISDWQRDQDL